MDSIAFSKFIWNFKNKSLTEDKFFMLQNAAKTWVFSPSQFVDIIECLPHSYDKKCAVNLLAKRIAGRLTFSTVECLLRKVVFSKDRLEILKFLVPFIDENASPYEINRFLQSAFDSKVDKAEALALLKKHFNFEEDNGKNLKENNSNIMDENFELSYLVHRCALENVEKRRSVFDLASVNSLDALHDALLSQESKFHIQSSIDLRVTKNHRFFIPSKISSILTHLKPGCHDENLLISQIPQLEPKKTNTAKTYAKILQKTKNKFLIKQQLANEEIATLKIDPNEPTLQSHLRKIDNLTLQSDNVTKIDVLPIGNGESKKNGRKSPENIPESKKELESRQKNLKVLGKTEESKKKQENGHKNGKIPDNIEENPPENEFINGKKKNENISIDDNADKVSNKSKRSLKKFLQTKKIIKAYFHSSKKQI